MREQHPGAAEARAFLEEARPLAQGLPNEEARLRALGCLLEGFAAFDPARAVALADEIRDTTERDSAMLEIALAVAAHDPELALGLIRRYRSQGLEDSEVESLAQALAVTWPEKAVELLGGIEDRFSLYRAVAEVAAAAAAPHPELALTLARSLGEPALRAEALRKVALGQLAARPEFARTIGDEVVKTVPEVEEPYDRALALAELARDLASVSREWAKEVSELALAAAQQVPAEGSAREGALLEVAGALARIYPDRAEEVARSLTEPSLRAEALARIAEALAPTQPDWAHRLIGEVTALLPQAGTGRDDAVALALANTLAALDPPAAVSFSLASAAPASRFSAAAAVVAQTHPEEALRAAEQAQDLELREVWLAAYLRAAPSPETARVDALLAALPERRDRLLRSLAEALAHRDPLRAHAVSQRIADPYWRVLALCDIAAARLDAPP